MFKLAFFAALLAIAYGSYINGGNPVGQSLGGSYVSNTGLLRGSGSPYSSAYGYGVSGVPGYPVGSGRSYSSSVSAPLQVVRQGYAGSPYSYGARNLPSGISYPSIPGAISTYGQKNGFSGAPGIQYPTQNFAPTAPQLLKNGYQGYNSFNGGYNGYPQQLNYPHQQQISYSQQSPINQHGQGAPGYNGLQGSGYSGW